MSEELQWFTLRLPPQARAEVERTAQGLFSTLVDHRGAAAACRRGAGAAQARGVRMTSDLAAVRALAKRLILEDMACRQELLAAQRWARPGQVLTLLVEVDALTTLKVVDRMVLVSPRTMVAVDPDGARVLADLALLEKMGPAVFLYIFGPPATDPGEGAAPERLAFAAALNPIETTA